MADNQGLKPIYIEQLFRSKNPGVAKMIPGFIYSYLKKVIHQDDINDFITRYGDRKGLDFSDAILEYLHVSYQVIGEANLPSPDGRYIFVSNHPLGGPDGIILISFLGTRYPELKFPVNDLLLNLKNLNNIFLPVNKHGAQAKDAVSALEDAYASDCQMIMFPVWSAVNNKGSSKTWNGKKVSYPKPSSIDGILSRSLSMEEIRTFFTTWRISGKKSA